jgi:ariadne-1
MERYCNDSEALLQECGVYFRCFPVTKKAAPKTRSLSVSCCPICYDDGVTMWNMPCGHDFCQGCAHDFCANAIQEGPACVRTTCPEAKCTEVIAEEEVALAAPELLPKYQSFQLRSFVDSNPLTRWCPGKGCERVACASSAVALEKVQNVARCDACMTSFCVICGDEPHEPSGCKIVQQWKGRCQGESTGCKNLQKWKDNRRKDFKSSNWVLSNTKGCPSCLVRIEKNDGCDHMTCT